MVKVRKSYFLVFSIPGVIFILFHLSSLITESHATTTTTSHRRSNFNHQQGNASHARSLVKRLNGNNLRNSKGSNRINVTSNKNAQLITNNSTFLLHQQALATERFGQNMLINGVKTNEIRKRILNSEEYQSTELHDYEDDEFVNNANMTLSPAQRFQQQIYMSQNANSIATRHSILDNSIKKECPTCATEQQNQNIPELTLRDVRLEFIKRRILHKLGLEEAPSTTNLENIPESVQKALHEYPTGDNDNYEDDFEEENSYGRTEQIVVFPEQVELCGDGNISVCLTFIVPSEIHLEKVSNAELWVHIPGLSGAIKEISVLQVPNTNEISPLEVEVVEVAKSEWRKLDLTDFVGNWSLPNFSKVLSKPDTKTLQLTCQHCVTLERLIDIRNITNKPFLIVNMAGAAKQKRSRRNINCSPGFEGCCRERLEVNFTEFRWNFIKAPKIYDAFFCKGSCLDSAGNVPYSDRHHIAHRQNIIHLRGLNNETALLLPCCAATKMSGITLLYEINNTIKRRTLPNMVVETCGCH